MKDQEEMGFRWPCGHANKEGVTKCEECGLELLACGIDLGTTHSLCAICWEIEPEKHPPFRVDFSWPRPNMRITPSVVSRDKETGELLVGLDAVENQLQNPEETIFSIKRLMGKRYDDKNVQLLINRVKYHIVRDEGGMAAVKLGDDVYSPTDISAEILKRLKADAEAHFGKKITHAVITVPAYFDNIQRQTTLEAGRMAGFFVKQMISEPVASTYAFGYGLSDDFKITEKSLETMESEGVPDDVLKKLENIKNQEVTGEEKFLDILKETIGDKQTVRFKSLILNHAKISRKILVFDFGGGTFDITIVRMKQPLNVVLKHFGDMWLGGDDVDGKLVDTKVKEIERKYGFDPTTDARFMVNLRQEVRRVKEVLCMSEKKQEEPLRLECHVQRQKNDGTPEFIEINNLKLTRREVETEASPFVDRAINLVKQALREANLIAREIDKVILVGGSSYLPGIQRGLRAIFPREVIAEIQDPMATVALGAAVLAKKIKGMYCEAICEHPNETTATQCAKCGKALKPEWKGRCRNICWYVNEPTAIRCAKCGAELEPFID
jgi:molecular chaperone DnaK